MTVADRRRAVIVAGHHGDVDLARAHVADADAGVRAAALSALDRLDRLDHEHIVDAFADVSPKVRRRAAELSASRPAIDLLTLLQDGEPTVAEAAAWACGEQQAVRDETLLCLIQMAGSHDEPLVREASAAALGAIGDDRGLSAILTACNDKPAVRRRAVLALAPFTGDDVEAAIERALVDRDWQVRQAAEDLRRATASD
jgi:HEAT repeat protein